MNESVAPSRQFGLVCRTCGCRHFEVVYTRKRRASIMRKRECRYCGKRILTSETIVQ